MIQAWLLLLTATVNDKPPCTAESRGRLWPEEANSGPALARRAAQCTGLEMCVRYGRRYRWEKVAVHVSQLVKNRPSGKPCATETEASAH
jgi:hypothetical protein